MIGKKERFEKKEANTKRIWKNQKDKRRWTKPELYLIATNDLPNDKLAEKIGLREAQVRGQREGLTHLIATNLFGVKPEVAPGLDRQCKMLEEVFKETVESGELSGRLLLEAAGKVGRLPKKTIGARKIMGPVYLGEDKSGAKSKSD